MARCTLRAAKLGSRASQAQGQRHSYFRNILGLQRSDAKGGTNNWQSLDKVKWLQHVITGEYVVVAGTAKHFLDTVSSGRPDMGFNLRTFQQLLANKLKTRRVGEVRETYKNWKLVSEPSMVRSLPDGTSLRNIMGVSPAAETAVPPLAQMSHEAVPVPSAAATQLLPAWQPCHEPHGLGTAAMRRRLQMLQRAAQHRQYWRGIWRCRGGRCHDGGRAGDGTDI